ncbi:MAG: hypothetical protein AB7G15_08005 [Alphaproteobacteria bacterium]
MRNAFSHWVTLFLAVVIGIVGLFLAAGAKDDGMYVAGMLLAIFGIVFSFTRIAALTDYSTKED